MTSNNKVQIKPIKLPSTLHKINNASYNNDFYTLIDNDLSLAIGVELEKIDATIIELKLKVVHFKVDGVLIPAIDSQGFTDLLRELSQSEVRVRQISKELFNIGFKEYNPLPKTIINGENYLNIDDVANMVGVSPEEIKAMFPEIREKIGR